MKTFVQVHEKKAFIFWFLNQYDMKQRESNWILTYLANHDKTLRNVYFVRHAEFCPRSIVISSKCSDKSPLRFYRNQLMTTNADKAFHDIRLNPFEPLYIELHFDQANQSPQYAFVLEENPFVSDEFYITKEDREQTEGIIDFTIQNHKRDQLLKEIDQALDSKNKEKFIYLTKELHKLDTYLNNQPIL